MCGLVTWVHSKLSHSFPLSVPVLWQLRLIITPALSSYRDKPEAQERQQQRQKCDHHPRVAYTSMRKITTRQKRRTVLQSKEEENEEVTHAAVCHLKAAALQVSQEGYHVSDPRTGAAFHGAVSCLFIGVLQPATAHDARRGSRRLCRGACRA